MMNPKTQENVGNATLQAISGDSNTQELRLQFDRDLLVSGPAIRLPLTLIRADYGIGSNTDLLWSRVGPGVLVALAPWTLSPGMMFGCYIPEGMTQIASAGGGRVLAALVWGYAT